MKISTNKFISLSYDLTVGEGEEKELMEQATVDTPLEFIFGTGSMLPAFENNLENLKENDEFNFILTPEEAYGEYNEEHVIDLPRDMFEQDGVLNEDIVFVGNTVPMMDASGMRLNGLILEVGDELVKMDFNHPLAGEMLNFVGKVLSVREATDEELAALVAPQGCGCGCGSGSCGPDDQDMGGCGSGSCGCGSGGCC